jgi:predicted SnoaL-like aldol condensation-catalyzing enzyme
LSLVPSGWDEDDVQYVVVDEVPVTRSPEGVLAAHPDALAQADLALILADYRDDAALLTPQGVFEGKATIETFFTQALGALPQAQFKATSSVVHGDAVLLHWTAESPGGRIGDGVDTFVVDEVAPSAFKPRASRSRPADRLIRKAPMPTATASNASNASNTDLVSPTATEPSRRVDVRKRGWLRAR